MACISSSRYGRVCRKFSASCKVGWKHASELDVSYRHCLYTLETNGASYVVPSLLTRRKGIPEVQGYSRMHVDWKVKPGVSNIVTLQT